jgi:diacylglycerol O-acyltransferase / trehalose O-mycolyltransferase
MTTPTVLFVSLLVGACGGGATTAGPSADPTPVSTLMVTPGASSTVPAATPAQATATPPPATATAIPATGAKPADDGARIVEVTTLDARTRDLRIDSPAVGPVDVRLLLPAGFAAQPTTRWPALYLLHGATGSHLDWTANTDVAQLTESTDLLVVMPDAGEYGYYSDWWNGGNGGPPMWETFHTVELPQLVERNWHASDKRVVAGLSMGGYGAMEYAARHRGMFLAAASYSGVLDPIGGDLDIDPNLWGDPVAQTKVWKAHDPLDIASALKGMDLYVAYGDGTRGPLDDSDVSSDDPEAWVHDQDVAFVKRLDALGIAVTVDAYGPGSHSWPYWERDLQRSLPMLLKAVER